MVYTPISYSHRSHFNASLQQKQIHHYKTARVQKDVERDFGVLQAKYQIIKNPAHQWYPLELKNIVDYITILHNMGIEYEVGMDDTKLEEYDGASYPALDDNRNVLEIQQLIQYHNQIQSKQVHHQLKSDLIEHVWNFYGMEQVLVHFVCHSLLSAQLDLCCHDLVSIDKEHPWMLASLTCHSL